MLRTIIGNQRPDLRQIRRRLPILIDCHHIGKAHAETDPFGVIVLQVEHCGRQHMIPGSTTRRHVPLMGWVGQTHASAPRASRTAGDATVPAAVRGCAAKNIPPPSAPHQDEQTGIRGAHEHGAGVRQADHQGQLSVIRRDRRILGVNDLGLRPGNRTNSRPVTMAVNASPATVSRAELRGAQLKTGGAKLQQTIFTTADGNGSGLAPPLSLWHCVHVTRPRRHVTVCGFVSHVR